LLYLVDYKDKLLQRNLDVIFLFSLIGFSGLINTWDVIFYFLLFLTIVLFYCYRKIIENPTFYFKKIILLLYPVLIVTLPWFLYFQSPAGVPNIVTKVTNLIDLFSFWGIYWISIIVISSTYLKNKTNFTFIKILIYFSLFFTLFLEMFYFMDVLHNSIYIRANTYYKFSNLIILLFTVSLSALIFLFFVSNTKKIYKYFLGLLITATFGFNSFFIYRSNEIVFTGIKSQEIVVSNYSPELLNLINFLKKNSNKDVNILEGSIEPYSNTHFVSVMTGIPTVIGWTNHQSTWRNLKYYSNEISSREKDVREIYTGEDIEKKREIISKYNVNYIVISKSEKDVFKENLKVEKITKLGEIVFKEGETYLIKTNYSIL